MKWYFYIDYCICYIIILVRVWLCGFNEFGGFLNLVIGILFCLIFLRGDFLFWFDVILLGLGFFEFILVFFFLNVVRVLLGDGWFLLFDFLVLLVVVFFIFGIKFVWFGFLWFFCVGILFGKVIFFLGFVFLVLIKFLFIVFFLMIILFVKLFVIIILFICFDLFLIVFFLVNFELLFVCFSGFLLFFVFLFLFCSCFFFLFLGLIFIFWSMLVVEIFGCWGGKLFFLILFLLMLLVLCLLFCLFNGFGNFVRLLLSLIDIRFFILVFREKYRDIIEFNI